MRESSLLRWGRDPEPCGVPSAVGCLIPSTITPASR